MPNLPCLQNSFLRARGLVYHQDLGLFICVPCETYLLASACIGVSGHFSLPVHEGLRIQPSDFLAIAEKLGAATAYPVVPSVREGIDRYPLLKTTTTVFCQECTFTSTSDRRYHDHYRNSHSGTAQPKKKPEHLGEVQCLHKGLSPSQFRVKPQTVQEITDEVDPDELFISHAHSFDAASHAHEPSVDATTVSAFLKEVRFHKLVKDEDWKDHRARVGPVTPATEPGLALIQPLLLEYHTRASAVVADMNENVLKRLNTSDTTG